MSVEKMHLVNIVGLKEQLDDFTINHLLSHDIHLVNTMLIADDVKGIDVYFEENPYSTLARKSKEIIDKISDINSEYLEQEKVEEVELENISELENYVNEFNKKIEGWEEEEKEIKEIINKKKKIGKQLLPMKDMDIKVDMFFKLKFIKFRFGSMPKYNYDKISAYEHNLDAIVLKVFTEEDKVYLIYFTMENSEEKIDKFFSALYFQRIFISGEVEGKPSQALKKLREDIRILEKKLETVNKLIKDYSKYHIEKLKQIYYLSNKYYQIFEARKYAAHSKEAFYLTGWVSETELKNSEKNIEQYDNVLYEVHDTKDVQKVNPPTKLKNNKFFEPFQVIVGMYGLPSYSEFDPTPMVAITYLLMFGMMFGDVGQGLVLALGGYLFFEKTSNMMGKVIMMAGFSSTIFGFIYGSVFGSEKLIPHLIAPMEQQYTILGIAVALGMGLIVMVMIINIINCFKNKQIGKALFDKNGVSGLVFYTALIVIIINFITKKQMIKNPIFIGICLVLPIIFIFLEKPLANIVEKKEHILPEDKGGFFIEAIFELLETALAIMSNSISFVRVGAFALNHVGLFMAFHVLAEMQGAFGSIIVNILGNIIIIGLEGLIVGIQGLRLEYYELFSRFFAGEGKLFKPFKINYDNIKN